MLATGLSVAVDAQSDLQRQKALFLYNFTNYVKWPDESAQIHRICMAAEDSMTQTLQAIMKKKDPTIQVQSLNAVGQPSRCTMIFIAKGFMDSSDVDSFEGHKTILTVSDAEGFSQQHGIVEFYEKADRLSLKINIRRTEEKGFRIDPRLLQLADRVR